MMLNHILYCIIAKRAKKVIAINIVVEKLQIKLVVNQLTAYLVVH